MHKCNLLAAVLGFAIVSFLMSVAKAADEIKLQDADQLLRQMSDTLAHTRHFSFKAHRQMDAALVPTGVIADARIEAVVQRPHRFIAHAASRRDSRRFVFDGRSLTLLDEKNNFYATVPMRTTIDGLMEKVDEVYGFTLPLAEFVLSNPYADFHRQARTVSYLGSGKVGGFVGIGGIECHRLALTGPLADAELWIGAADHLPYKLLATFKKHPARPQLKAEFSSWNLAATTPDRAFTFVPPKGAMKIEMLKKH